MEGCLREACSSDCLWCAAANRLH